MKRNIILVLAGMLAIASTQKAQAQRGEMKLNLYYNYGIPSGTFQSDVISKGSPRGGGGDILYNINRVWSVGMSAAFQDYYQKYPRAVYNTGKNEQISAVLSNSIQTTPILAKAVFNPLGRKRSSIQPYLSAGAGVSLVSDKQYLGQFESSDASTVFTGQVGAGVQIPFGKFSNAGLMVGANYNYVPYNRNELSNLNTVDLRLGIYLPLR
jgi:hypothetical protein